MMLNQILIGVLVFVPIILADSKYKIKIDRIDYMNYNEAVVVSANVFIYNRTTKAVNVTFKLFNDCCSSYDTIHVKTYEFLNNEYKPFAIDTKRKVCDFLKLEYNVGFYKDMSATGSQFIPNSCPVKKGEYYIYNYIPASIGYVNLPFTNVKVEFSMLRRNKLIWEITAYAKFDRDSVFREKYE